MGALDGPSGPDSASTIDLDTVVEELRRALATIRHGSVTLIVQDGRIVQIDTTQKLRLERRAAGGSGGRRA